jgi:hypothetical protein
VIKIKANVDALVKSLQAEKNKLKKKLEYGVTEWAYAVVENAIQNTPLGSTASTRVAVPVIGGRSRGYDFKSLYDARPSGWVKEPGLTRGNWQVSLNYDNIDFLPTRNQEGAALSSVSSTLDNFKLGDTIFIGNDTPYIMKSGVNVDPSTARGEGRLEFGYSKQFSSMAMPIYTMAYKLNFKQFYDRSA